MKIVFVHLGRENLGIEYLSSVLKQHGHKTSLVFDPGIFSPNDNIFYIPWLENFFSQKEAIIRNILLQDPDLIAFSVYTNTYIWCCQVAKEIKELLPYKKIVFGGIHPTLVPDRVINNEFVDYVVFGEGEYALLELVKNLEQDKQDTNIRNVWFKKDEKILKNPLREPIADLDCLPFPDKEIFENYVRYKDDYMILTSRGCIFNCTYCCESYLNKLYCNKYFRRRGVQSVMAELNYMKKRYNFREVMFFDGILFTDKNWLQELMSRFKREIGVPFRCTGHVNFIDEEVVSIMKDSGCYCIDFGIQSLNELTRKNVLNRYESNKKIKEAFNICDKFGLRYDVDFMFGLPREGEKDYKLVLDFFAGRKYLNRLKCYNLSYYPRCKITEIAKDKGILNKEDINKIEQGKIGDWFHVDDIKDRSLKRTKDNFQIFFKVLPLLPSFSKQFIIRYKLYRGFHFVPFYITVLFQIIIALKNKDYRFTIYPKNYIYQIRRILVTKLKYCWLVKILNRIDLRFKLKRLLLTVIRLIKAKFLNKKIPLLVSWGITDRCNYNCPYCYIPDIKKNKELTINEVFSTIDELAMMGTVRINFTGGEPLMRDDIDKILRYAEVKGIYVGINSNGALVPEKINALKGIDILTLSFDGPENIQDTQRQSGSYKNLISAIKTAQNHKIKVMLYTVLTKYNVGHIDFILNFAKEFRVKVTFSPVQQFSFQKKDIGSFSPVEDAYKRAIKKLVCAKKQGNPYIANSLSGLKYIYNWPKYKRINCVAGKIHCRIQPNGDIYGCGNLINKSPKLNCIQLGFNEAFRKISNNSCRNCWCANKVEMNLAWSLNPEVILNAVKLA